MWYLIAALAVLLGSGLIADTVIDYEWWKEIGQTQTWINLMVYGFAPVAACALAAGLALWVALARGLKSGGHGLGDMPGAVRFSVLGALGAGLLLAMATIDSWTVMRYLGGRGVGGEAAAWRDPFFQEPLGFYLFSLPFYQVAYRYVIGLAVLAGVVYWAAGRLSQIRTQIGVAQRGGEIDLRGFDFGFESHFLRGAAVVFLLGLAVSFYLERYALVVSDHGFLVGIDYVDEHVRLPILYLFMAAAVVSAAAVAFGKWRVALILVVMQLAQGIVPWAVTTLYVRPNEISLQKPYIERHIEATRHAFGLDRRMKESEFNTRMETRIDPNRHRPLLENVRLWDWRAFHDTVTQIQALRPYYVFADSDVDRYTIDGKLQQVLLTPRELDINQLPDARKRWINPHFIYTHGYGMVMAEANRITSDGLPHLFVQDAPPRIRTSSLKLTRPEIYFGEVVHEPVFVRTGEKEFSYPSGNDSVFTRYEGKGGFPISSFPLRIAAALRNADPNVILTGLFTSDSRMMIRRNVRERLKTAAAFVTWDEDPYLVVTGEGRLVWTVDGYTMSDSHPYSHNIRVGNVRTNYMRNSVKATVDAYDGEIRLYLFDPSDPIVQAYSRLFPGLFQPAAAMPASIRAHLRYPETIFRAQAEVYRTYHMRDPQAFYNKEDIWDIARNVYGRDSRRQPLPPTYVVASLPGSDKPEFLLMLPFTPLNKDNLIGLMVAHCDGERLGDLEVLQLSKQQLMFGPMQIEARIDQAPEISRDLSLWSQKGSEVLRGQMLVLPIEDSFLYVEPIYIQAAEARMPQLQKVVVAMGNTLIYRNTYEEALAELSGVSLAAAAAAGAPKAAEGGKAPETGQAAGQGPADARVEQIRQRLRRYRELWSQGKYAEAGKELEAIEALAGGR